MKLSEVPVGKLFKWKDTGGIFRRVSVGNGDKNAYYGVLDPLGKNNWVSYFGSGDYEVALLNDDGTEKPVTFGDLGLNEKFTITGASTDVIWTKVKLFAGEYRGLHPNGVVTDVGSEWEVTRVEG